jgi:hypothetical protein
MPGPAFFSGTMNIAKNEDWSVPLEYLVDYTPVSGDPENIQPLDITDSTFKLQIRKTEADNTAVVTVETGDGIEITNAAGGEFTVTITRAKLKRLHAGDYFGDLVRTDPNGFAERMWEGKVIVVEGVSR